MKRAMLASMIFAGALMAQPGMPPDDGPGPRGEALQNALNITAEQADALRTFVREQRESARESLDGIFEQMRTHREALQAALEADNPNPEEIGRLMVEGKALREKVKAAHDTAEEAIRQYVTITLGRADELAKLEAAAELMPAVGQARMMGLIEGPDGPGLGFGPGMGMFGARGRALGRARAGAGPMGFGRGRGPAQ